MNSTDMAALGSILGVWAHPDDEAFLSAGLMAAARDAGNHVACVTATRGEHGTGDPVAWPPARLARTRTTELRASLAALDVHDHHFLDIEDGSCARAPFTAIVARLSAVVAAAAPDTIVTFGPDGFTGHEDHQVVSRWATAARRLAAPTSRLLYVTTTDEFARRWHPLHRDLDVFLVPELPLRTPADDVVVEVRLDDDLADRKLAALRAQPSQTAPLVDHVGEETFRRWWSVESFVDADSVLVDRQWSTWRTAA